MRAIHQKFFKLALLCGLMGMPSLSVRADDDESDSFAGAWKVTVQPDEAAVHAGKDTFTDEVLFEDGCMTASACSSYGFGPSQYALLSGGSQFSTTTSIEGESIAWSGQLVAGRLSGNVVWTKADGQVFHYSLSGVRMVAEDEQHGSDD